MPTGLCLVTSSKLYVAARIQQATSSKLDVGACEVYLSQWRGPEGQAAYLRKEEGLAGEGHGGGGAAAGLHRGAVRLVWGEEDRWVDPSLADKLQEEIPDSVLDLFVAGAGHFVMEDAPQEVAEILFDFFSKDARGT